MPPFNEAYLMETSERSISLKLLLDILSKLIALQASISNDLSTLVKYMIEISAFLKF